MPKLSVIIPVYNVENYLSKCIESVINQSFKDFELILINDGSTDRSGQICDEYLTKDKRIRVIHKNNEGVSKARNIGIDESKGEYLIFIDSDDWIEYNTFQCLIENIEIYKSDLIISGMIYDYYENEVLISNIKKTTDFLVNVNKKSLQVNFSNLFEKVNFLSSCNKMFLSKIIKNNNIKFDENSIIYEDFNFNLNVINNSNNITIVPNLLYHYRINSQECILSKRRKINLVSDIHKVSSSLLNFLNEINVCEEEKIKFYEYIFVLYHHCLNKLTEERNFLVSKEKRSVLRELSNDKIWRLVMNNYGYKLPFYKVLFMLMKVKLYAIAYWLIIIKL